MNENGYHWRNPAFFRRLVSVFVKFAKRKKNFECTGKMTWIRDAILAEKNEWEDDMTVSKFKESLSTINDSIYFDEHDYLREKTSDPLKLNQLIGQAETLVETCNDDDKYFYFGTLGNLYRIYGQPKKAIDCLTSCLLQAVEEKNQVRETVSLIRLGEALKYDSNHHEALAHFNKALEICEANELHHYLDFALQHKGKCLMEMALLNEAEECFQKAIALRKRKGDLSLVDSTEQAIRLIGDMKRCGGDT